MSRNNQPPVHLAGTQAFDSPQNLIELLLNNPSQRGIRNSALQELGDWRL